MRILLVTRLFPPDKGVSTFRMHFFHEKLTAAEHVVDVLKVGELSDFTQKIKTIDQRLFGSLFSTVLNRYKIKKCISPLLLQYDLVLVSATPYGLYEVAHAAECLGVPFILDLRDLPDLTTSEQKGTTPFYWLLFKSWLIDLYIKNIAKKALAVLCVGTISTAITQIKLKDSNIRVVNIHNGFNLDDMYLVQNQSTDTRFDIIDGLITCCVGNIFNFRDTLDLRNALGQLNERNEKVTLMHWGKVSAHLLTYIQTLSNINYVPCQSIPRKQLLQELHRADCFLLPCSDDLIWEPTTSVFDYILFNKPVIFTGLHNNEAYIILENTCTKIVKTDQLSYFDFQASEISLKKDEILLCYSREFYLERLLETIEQAKLYK